MKMIFVFLFFLLGACTSVVEKDPGWENPLDFHGENYQLCPKIEDPRDGEEYSCVLVGETYWMSENLRLQEGTGMDCWGNNQSQCEKGVLYNGNSIVEEVEKSSCTSASCQVRSVCPEGWHLPTRSEWYELVGVLENLKETSFLNADTLDLASVFKGKETWAEEDTEDFLGLKFLPTGFYDGALGKFALLDSAFQMMVLNDVESESGFFWSLRLALGENEARMGPSHMEDQVSIRCVKNERFLGNLNDVLSSFGVQSSSSLSFSSSSFDDTGIVFPNVEVSSITDLRDGIDYEVYLFNGVYWMAENLRYNSENSKCYDDSESLCNFHGRLYTWQEALQGQSSPAGGCSGADCWVQGVCPLNYHIPTQKDWVALADYFAGIMGTEESEVTDLNVYTPGHVWPEIGAYMKDVNYWQSQDLKRASLRFDAKASGWIEVLSKEMGVSTSWWSANISGEDPFYWELHDRRSDFRTLVGDSTLLRSVRCVRDQ